jgi:DnaJ-class molecular chaperone
MRSVSVTIVEKRESHTVIECQRCDGNGVMLEHHRVGGTSDCETCSGNGIVKISKTPPFYECGRCSGRGWVGDDADVDYGERNTCPNCDGTGVASESALGSY